MNKCLVKVLFTYKYKGENFQKKHKKLITYIEIYLYRYY